MGITFTLFLSLAVAFIASITKKYYTDKNITDISGCFVFNAVNFFVAAVVLLCWGGFGESSLFTILLGILFGAVTALGGITNVVALQCGPMSYTQVIISFSTLISALSGVMFYDESLGWAQIVGMIFMLISFALAAEKGNGEKRANLKWLVVCFVAFVATGGIGVMQKVHQSSIYKNELNAFLIIAFLSATIFCSLLVVFLKQRQDKFVSESKKERTDKKQLLLMLCVMLIGGVCTGLNHKFNLYLSGVMDSAVFFPIVNGGGLVLATLAAVLLFKEKLSKKQWIGVVLGIVSVVFLCNPFA